MIRGAIAFGLTTNISNEFRFKYTVQNTVLILVIATTLIFGTFFALVQKMLVGGKKKEEEMFTQKVEETDARPSIVSLNQSVRSRDEAAEYIRERKLSKTSMGKQSDATKYFEIKHPNMMTEPLHEEGRDTDVSGVNTIYQAE